MQDISPYGLFSEDLGGELVIVLSADSDIDKGYLPVHFSFYCE